MIQHTATTPRLVLDLPVRQLLDRVDAEPMAPLCLALPAPGGYGKSTVLTELGRRYISAGVPVRTMAEAGARPVADPDEVLLVDDAHLLGAEALGALAEVAEAGGRLAVAYRPWPRPAELTELVDRLGRTGPVLPLAPWDRGQVAERLAALAIGPAGLAFAQFVHDQTGGVPRLVGYLGAALSGGSVPVELRLPDAAIVALRAELDRLDPEVARFVLAVEAGVGRHVELLAALLDTDTHGVGAVMDAARATGLLGADGSLLPITRRAVAALVPAERRIGVRQRLAELQHARGGPVLDLARSLLGTGVGGAGVAAVFLAAAGEAEAGQPTLAASLYAASVAAGTPLRGVAVAWARVAARAGDLDRALRLADQAIGTPDAPDRAAAAEVAGAALAHRGQLGRSAELYRWAGAGFPAAFAEIGLVGTGQHVDTGWPVRATDGPPTLLAGAASLMAQGVRASVAGSATAVLAQLVRAASLLEPAGHTLLLPDSPAALAALVGLHAGELGLAESVLDRAVSANLGGPLLATRHRLLQAWLAMTRGQLVPAREQLTTLTKATRVLEPRDWLFAVALEVGLARRNSDLNTLRRIWGQACEAVMRHPVDLFTLLPLGEFAVAAARLGDQDRLRPHLFEATALLSGLGDPPLWSTPLHWHRLHEAIVAEQPAEAEQHAVALAANAAQGAYCAALARAAGSWLAVIGGRVDADEVEAAARGLHDIGLAWDGARLAGQAAIRTADRRAMVSLLNCARVLQGKPARPVSAVPTTAATVARAADGAPAELGAGVLSDREREVAVLVLAGLTYKQVGDRLFISAKTVEHHVARMRQKLNAASRAELLDQLRRLTGAR